MFVVRDLEAQSNKILTCRGAFLPGIAFSTAEKLCQDGKYQDLNILQNLVPADTPGWAQKGTFHMSAESIRSPLHGPL